MEKLKIVCSAKEITVERDGPIVRLSFDYGSSRPYDVGLDLEEASYLVGAIRTVLGQESAFKPKERIVQEGNGS